MATQDIEKHEGDPLHFEPGITDVVFEVEGKEIHFCKALLIVSSPVFARMFTSDFKEKSSEDPIPFPEKEYEEFVHFLKQFHPAFCWRPITESDLESLLKLADEYAVKHVKEKCEAFIRDRLKYTTDCAIVMKMLYVAQKYRLTDIQEPLMTVAASFPRTAIKKSSDYDMMDISAQRDLMEKLCEHFEQREDEEMKEFETVSRLLRKVKEIVLRLPDLAFPLSAKCQRQCKICIASLEEVTCDGACDCYVTQQKKAKPISLSSVQRFYCRMCASLRIRSVLKYLPIIWKCIEKGNSNFIRINCV